MKCAVKSCGLDAVYEIWGGSDRFHSSLLVYTCLFDRDYAIAFFNTLFRYVDWKDCDG